MTRHPLTLTSLRRRDNAEELIRSDARRPGTVNPVAYANARRILTDEYGYDHAQVARIWGNAKRAAR